MSKPARYLITILCLLCAFPGRGGAVVLTGLVAFGDSLSDVRNSYDKLLSVFGAETVLQAGLNPNFVDVGRWSNGPVWVEDLNNRLGFLDLQKNDGTGGSGLDFAWGGATSDGGFSAFVLKNLQMQVGNFTTLQAANPSLFPDPGTTLFTVWAGGNDVINYVGGNTSITPGGVAANLGTAITNLYNLGGRYFLVPNLPPLGDKPDFRNTGNQTLANNFVDLYNTALTSTLNGLAGNLTGLTIVPYDVHALFEDVLANPGNYGIGNTTAPAFVNDPDGAFPFGTVVADPNSYLFWDNTHPTTTIHQELGNQTYAAVIAAIPEPGMGAWAGGMVVLWVLGRKTGRGRRD